MSNLGWFTSFEKLGIPDLWTPAMIDTALWLDAADASTVVLNGSDVSMWKDKSGNSGNNVIQGTPSAQPSYTSRKLCGKPVIDFNGSSEYLVSENNILTVSSLALFVVYMTTNINLMQGVVNKTNPTNSGFTDFEWQYGVRVLEGGTDGKTEAVVYGTSTYTSAVSSAPLVNSTWVIECCLYTQTYMQIIRNGLYGAPVSYATTLFNSGKAAANRVYVGIRRPGLRPLSGAIAEIICTLDVTRVDVILKTFGYLAHKWGLAK
ncbi:hypothetical protein LLG39_08885 [bacterium]|nr:hypothetical protein [bacterium]